MALFNYATKEITLKVVYYGPGLCGKTTNLQYLHESMSPEKKGKLLSLSTDADRTLFFDFMPIHLGKIKGFNIRFQLYTVPGQVRYNATRKLVLKGGDAVVFVADSQSAMKEANIESLRNMKENLVANNIKPEDIPVVLQYNKRDLPNIMPIDEINQDINPTGDEVIQAVAVHGTGVYETFQLITKRLLRFISKKHNVQIDIPDELETKKPAPAAASAQQGKVNISVPDKNNALLDEPSAFSEQSFEQDILQASMPQEKEEVESAYSGAQLDT
jgi:small GTP-binding protein